MMFNKKIGFIFTLSLILLFSIMSVAQAAPPLQEPDSGVDDTTTTTDSFTLDQDGNNLNLGCIMSGRCESPSSEEEENQDPDCSEEDPNCSEEDPNCSEEDPNCSEEEGNEDPNCSEEDPNCSEEEDGEKHHKVAEAIANYFGEDYETIMELHDNGMGFGLMVLALAADITTDQLLEMDVHGWGNIKKMYLNGNELEEAGGNQDGPPGQLKKGNSDDTLGALSGPGGGKGNNGNGQGQGNKGGNGKGVSGKPSDKPEGGQGNGNKGGKGGGNGKGPGKNK